MGFFNAILQIEEKIKVLSQWLHSGHAKDTEANQHQEKLNVVYN